MTYHSSRPTSEKRKLFEFMERNKRRGVVGARKLGSYAKKKGIKLEYEGSSKTTGGRGYGPENQTMYWYNIKKHGKKIGEAGIKNKNAPKVVWWKIS